MRQTTIAAPAAVTNYATAASLARAIADEDRQIIEPVMVAAYDRTKGTMAPAVPGARAETRWRDYGASHGGRLEINIGKDFGFIFAEGSPFDPYEASPYANLRDASGNEFVCQINLLGGRRTPDSRACVAVDEWTSKLT